MYINGIVYGIVYGTTRSNYDSMKLWLNDGLKRKMAEPNSLPAMGKWSPRYMSQGIRNPAGGICVYHCLEECLLPRDLSTHSYAAQFFNIFL